MLANILQVGNKIELTGKYVAGKGEEPEKKLYISQVFDVIDDTRVKVAMPIENGHVVALSVKSKLEACFYTVKGLYSGKVEVVERMKEGSVYVMVIELLYELKKFQRRQYYRLNCTMDLQHRILDNDESVKFIEKKYIPHNDEIKGMNNGVALDFSGGGVRFISEARYKKNDLMFIRLQINNDDNLKTHLLVGRVISSIEGKNRRNYENRIEFMNVDGKVREEIIRYIFMEERRQRQKISENR